MVEEPWIWRERRGAAPAWWAVALTPVGVVVGIAVAYGIAAAIGATLDPANGATLTFAQNFLVYGIASIVWLAAPVSAVVLAARRLERSNVSAIAALATGVLALSVLLFVSVANLASW